MTTLSITTEETKQYKRFMEEAAEGALQEAGVDRQGFDRLVKRSGDFQSAIISVIHEFSIGNPYADEEVRTNCRYHETYKIQPLSQQIASLCSCFPVLSSKLTREFIESELPVLKLPRGAEGWFAIPKWDRLARSYGEATELILKAFAVPNLRKNPESKLDLTRFRQQKRTAEMLAEIGNEAMRMTNTFCTAGPKLFIRNVPLCVNCCGIILCRSRQ